MSITVLPTELVNRIITIGCEELPEAHRGSLHFKSRRLKGFAATASSVCCEWRALVLSPSNYHLWSTDLALYYGPTARTEYDIAVHISEFMDVLSKSRLSDIDLSLELPEDDKLLESLMVHLLAFIAPYSHQIRSFVLWSRPLRKIVSVLQTIQPLPRLARCSLGFWSDKFVDTLDDVFSFGPGGSILDLSTGINCREVEIGSWALRGMILPIDSISSLVINFKRLDAHEWGRLATFLEAQRYLRSLSFTSLLLVDTPSSWNGTSSAEACFPHLHTLALRSDISSILTFMTHLNLPQLTSLELSTYTSNSSLRKVLRPPDMTLSRLTRLRRLHLVLLGEESWTPLHDHLIQATLPLRLDSLTVVFASKIFNCCTSILSERPVVANLEIRMFSYQQHLAALLSRWNPEKINFNPDSLASATGFAPRGALGALVAMEKLRSLSFEGESIDDLGTLLSQYTAPELQKIKVKLLHPRPVAYAAPADSVNSLEQGSQVGY